MFEFGYLPEPYAKRSACRDISFVWASVNSSRGGNKLYPLMVYSFWAGNVGSAIEPMNGSSRHCRQPHGRNPSCHECHYSIEGRCGGIGPRHDDSQ